MNRKIVLIAHDIRSCHNVGSLFRTCEGMGIEKLFLTGYTPYPILPDDSRLPHLARKIDKQIDKTALGAQKTLSWEKDDSLENVLDGLKKQGYLVAALEQSPKSIPLDIFRAPEKIALIIGNEVSGIDNKILEKMDKIVEIKMFGEKESFNVVQAAAMALYSLRFAG